MSFLIGALLFLATTILFILIRVDEFDVLDTVFVYFIIFCFFSVSIIKLKTQKIFPAIATNFIVIVTSFIPLYFVMYWYFLKIEQENNKFMYNHDQLRERMWHYAQRAEYIGFFCCYLVFIFYTANSIKNGSRCRKNKLIDHFKINFTFVCIIIDNCKCVFTNR